MKNSPAVTMNHRRRSKLTRTKRAADGRDPVRLYEHFKSAWIATHPEATPREYQRAMQRIAAHCNL